MKVASLTSTVARALTMRRREKLFRQIKLASSKSTEPHRLVTNHCRYREEEWECLIKIVPRTCYYACFTRLERKGVIIWSDTWERKKACRYRISYWAFLSPRALVVSTVLLARRRRRAAIVMRRNARGMLALSQSVKGNVNKRSLTGTELGRTNE